MSISCRTAHSMRWEGQIKFANTWDYDGLVYGVPSTGNAQGVVYNKRVFTEAGVAETPKTPDEFIAALQAIKDYDLPSFRSTRTTQTDGRWSSGTDRSQVRQPVILLT